MRVATIDVGTNTVSLLIADVGLDGGLSPVVEIETITRLGAGVDASRIIAEDAASRTLACLAQYAGEIASARCDAVAAVGTSALRDAHGGVAFRERARAIVGVELRVLSGEEEAAATFSGATTDRREGGSRALFDIGGGSTEIVVGDASSGSISFATSLDIGSVRLTERFLHADPPTRAELDALSIAVQRAIEPLPRFTFALAPIGVAGTMTTLASVALALERFDAARVHGASVPTNVLEATLHELASKTAKQRAELPAMVAARADVIVAGGWIAVALLQRFGASAVVVSDRGVRWGLASELAHLRA